MANSPRPNRPRGEKERLKTIHGLRVGSSSGTTPPPLVAGPIHGFSSSDGPLEAVIRGAICGGAASGGGATGAGGAEGAAQAARSSGRLLAATHWARPDRQTGVCGGLDRSAA